MAQSCLHVVINFPRPPKPDQNMLTDRQRETS